MAFTGSIVFFGYGSVAQCTLPILLERIKIKPQQITVIDMNPNLEEELKVLQVQFKMEEIQPGNLEEILTQNLEAGDLLIDLAWEIDTCQILAWCRQNNVLYTNASLEIWNPYMDARKVDPREFTLYARHQRLKRMIQSWPDNKGATAVIDHGANPGLVSHFLKRGLKDIAEKILEEEDSPEIKAALEQKAWNHLAHILGVKVIHISERDTQITNQPKEVNEFVNTWSPEGLYEEGVAPAELGWGTHEKTLPSNALEHEVGPKNQILLKSKGMNTWVRSWVPSCEDINGMVIRHGEAYTISDYLTVYQNGEAIYRPTVHYAYCPSDSTIASLHELKMRHYQMSPTLRVLNEEIISGQDILGCLIMGHKYKSWWIGSLLDIKESRQLVPHQNATTLQVAAAVVAGIEWMINHPNEGVKVPDELPYEVILEVAQPYLGQIYSGQVDWTPLEGIQKESSFNYNRDDLPKDPWQFGSFLLD